MEGKFFLGHYLIWVMLLLCQIHGYKCCILKERKALLELKSYMISKTEESKFERADPALRRFATWTNDTMSDCCRWNGINCNRSSGRVIRISIGVEDFRESSLLNLSLLHPFDEVRSLDLSGNKHAQTSFNGFFDNVEGYKSLKNLRNLEVLDLSFNSFTNNIFPFLSAATSLTTLILKGNRMTGTFPTKEVMNFPKLEFLNLARNSVTGPISVVCEMKNLWELDLSENHFVGQLPLCVGSLKKLRVLDLSSNKLSGNLPYSFSGLESLEYLSLLDNNLTGLFSLNPLSNLTKLKVLKFSSKSHMVQVETGSSWKPKFQLSVVVLRSCSLETIPSFLVYQKKLRLVDLSSNILAGDIPTWLLMNNTELEVLQLQNNCFTIFQMPTIVHHLEVLDFSANHIGGMFPDNICRALPNLVHMNGASNGFQGKFPSSMGEMKNILFLDLSYNNFSGELPRSFLTGCSSLKSMKLSYNKFSGNFLTRETSFTSLEVLRIDNNLFTGKIGIGLLNFTLLLGLDMSHNCLTGAIPSWMAKLNQLDFLLLSNNFLEGRLPPSLLLISFLDLSGNSISGSLPSSHTQAVILFLNNNNFTGPIPDTLLEGVEILDLRNNKLSGSIPQFVNTQDIKFLLLRGNNLTGSIPWQLCELSNIGLLDLSGNKLNGFIPTCLNKLSVLRGGEGNNIPYGRISGWQIFQSEYYKSTFVVEKFQIYITTTQELEIKFATKQRYESYSPGQSWMSDPYSVGGYIDSHTDLSVFSRGILDYMFGMDLSNNELSGAIPTELGDLLKLRALNLSHNFLSSSIPSSFSNLKDIESLDLSYNKLHGSIPYQLTSLTSLAVFDVSHNNLAGIIPQGRQFNTFNESNYLGNPLLCGPPTHISCEAKKSSEEADNGGGEEEDEAAIDRLVFYSSTASVYVTALIGIIVLMCFDCPWRRAWLRIVDAFIASVKSMLP